MDDRWMSVDEIAEYLLPLKLVDGEARGLGDGVTHRLRATA